MAIREIIEIDEALCDGCGACETGCPEGALRVIEGKARLVGESLCDGLGACIGECPRGAITVSRREAVAYDERKVMEGLSRLGPKVIAAHLGHLRHHGQDAYAREALAFLAERGIPVPDEARPAAVPTAQAAPGEVEAGCGGGCPGSASRRFGQGQAMRGLVGAVRAAPRPAGVSATPAQAASASASALGHWPIQLHLVNPRAPQYQGAELLVAADCTAFALGGFHGELLAGRSLVIACPKLDQGREIYLEKLAVLLAQAASVTIAVMEVPCCGGLLKMLLEARESLQDKPPVRAVVVGVEGGIRSERVY